MSPARSGFRLHCAYEVLAESPKLLFMSIGNGLSTQPRWSEYRTPPVLVSVNANVPSGWWTEDGVGVAAHRFDA
jgi:hypothetical protein